MNLPPLTITSYLRNSGSHSDGKAIDLALSDRPSNYLQRYFSVYLALIKLSKGDFRIWIAKPGQCEHYHIDLSESGYAMEKTKLVNGSCYYDSIAERYTGYQDALERLSERYKSLTGQDFVPIDYTELNFDEIRTHRLPSNEHTGAIQLLFEMFAPSYTTFGQPVFLILALFLLIVAFQGLI